MTSTEARGRRKRPAQARRAALGRIAAIAAAALAVVAGQSVYVVGQASEAVLVRLGRPVAVVNPVGRNDPGLKLKWPFIDQAVLFDKRNQPVEADQAEVAAAGRDRLSVDAAMRFRIVDPLRFYRALGDEQAAEPRLQALLTESLANVLGTASAQDILSDGREALMQRARVVVAGAAHTSGFGIQVLDVRLLGAAPSASGLEAIYRRMRASHEQQGDQIRADGEQRKREIMAEADKAAAVIRGDANGQAEQIRGAGEAKRAAIFTQAYGRDPEFAEFLRTMQAYRETLGQGDTTIVLTPQSAFLHDMTAAGAPKPAAP